MHLFSYYSSEFTYFFAILELEGNLLYAGLLLKHPAAFYTLPMQHFDILKYEND